MARWKSVSSWSNRFVSAGVLALLAACQSAPPKPVRAPAPEAQAPAAAAHTTAPSGAAAGAGVAAGAAGNPAAAPDAAPIPERATQQYAQALQLMKSGRTTDAELEFKQLAAGYPDRKSVV